VSTATVAVLGAGDFGSRLALALLVQGSPRLAGLRLVDPLPGRAAALAADLRDLAATRCCPGPPPEILGGEDPELLRGAERVVVAAGYPPAPGVDAASLHPANARIATALGRDLAATCPGAWIYVVSEPSLVCAAQIATSGGLDPGRIVALGPTLALRRVHARLARALGLAAATLRCEAWGGDPPDLWVPLASLRDAQGQLDARFAATTLQDIVSEALRAAPGLTSLGGSGSTSSADAAWCAELLARPEAALPQTLVCGGWLSERWGLDPGWVTLPFSLGPARLLGPSEGQRPSTRALRALEAALRAPREAGAAAAHHPQRGTVP